jgi:hypothetical protein
MVFGGKVLSHLGLEYRPWVVSNLTVSKQVMPSQSLQYNCLFSSCSGCSSTEGGCDVIDPSAPVSTYSTPSKHLADNEARRLEGLLQQASDRLAEAIEEAEKRSLASSQDLMFSNPQHAGNEDVCFEDCGTPPVYSDIDGSPSTASDGCRTPTTEASMSDGSGSNVTSCDSKYSALGSLHWADSGSKTAYRSTRQQLPSPLSDPQPLQLLTPEVR